MEKVDFKKTLKHLYNPPKKFEIVDVPEMQFIMADGRGDPNTAQEYADAVEALYAVAYKMKFIGKKELEKDYTVHPREGRWWAKDMETLYDRHDDENAQFAFPSKPRSVGRISWIAGNGGYPSSDKYMN